jgi:hypothetical protein
MNKPSVLVCLCVLWRQRARSCREMERFCGKIGK